MNSWGYSQAVYQGVLELLRNIPGFGTHQGLQHFRAADGVPAKSLQSSWLLLEVQATRLCQALHFYLPHLYFNEFSGCIPVPSLKDLFQQ